MSALHRRFSLPFTRILTGEKHFILETLHGSYRLTTGISEHYILMNLAAGVKQQGYMVMETGEEPNSQTLKPVAVVHEDRVVWITVTPDEKTKCSIPEDLSFLAPFLTDGGEDYPDGFIDSSRTSLSYKELMKYEKLLDKSVEAYAKDFYTAYYRDYPQGAYDVRLHYWMIHEIHKHDNYIDDFTSVWVDLHTFYRGWSDPFPWYLVIETFESGNDWPGYAKMRLLAENKCREGIPLALSVLSDKTLNNRTLYYALVVAGLDPANDEYILSFRECCPRAMLRIFSQCDPKRLYLMLLQNARQVLAGFTEDLLDDPQENYTGLIPVEDIQYMEYTIGQRGYVSLALLSEKQIKEVGAIYLKIADRLAMSSDKSERFRLGNALRSFLIALSSSNTRTASSLLWRIYTRYPDLIYGVSAQDSKLLQIDLDWAQYLYDFSVEHEAEDDLLERLSYHERDYKSMAGNRQFFLLLFARVGYNLLLPDEFYAIFHYVIHERAEYAQPIWLAVTEGKQLADDSVELDHRWSHMFEDFDYGSNKEQMTWFYQLVKHRIELHPSDWNIDQWRQELPDIKQDSDQEENDPLDDYFGFDDLSDLDLEELDREERREMEEFYESLMIELVMKAAQDSSGILIALLQRLHTPGGYLRFPDQTDQMIAGKREREIRPVNKVVKGLLEKIRKGPSAELLDDKISPAAIFYTLTRHYLIALSRNPHPAARQFIKEVYATDPELFYMHRTGEYQSEQDHYWMNYMVDFVGNRN